MSSDLNFSIRIGAEDATKPAIASAQAGFKKFFSSLALKPITLPFQIGRAGLGVLRDLNLGLRPLVAGIDSLIERGSAVSTIRKAFESLTQTTGNKAGHMASRIVDAASGTLRLAEAMSIANRAMGSGLRFDQLLTAVEFISKKSVAVGKDARQSLDTVITGLSRGSTLFLDDFGILVDGLDGVKRSFDALNGKGAFDALTPSAQKAETVRAAIAEMADQMKALGITGNEVVFVWQRIKNAIGSATDRLFAAIANSKTLQRSLGVVRDIVDGLANFFEGGGTFKTLFLGSDGGGGILGIFKTAAVMFAELVGKGILIGIVKGAAFLLRALTEGLFALKRVVETVLIEPLSKKVDQWIKPIGDSMSKVGDRLVKFFDELSPIIDRAKSFLGIGDSAADTPPAAKTQPTVAPPASTTDAAAESLGDKAYKYGVALPLARLKMIFDWWMGVQEFFQAFPQSDPTISRDFTGQPIARGGPAGTIYGAGASLLGAAAMGAAEKAGKKAVKPAILELFSGIREAFSTLKATISGGGSTESALIAFTEKLDGVASAIKDTLPGFDSLADAIRKLLADLGIVVHQGGQGVVSLKGITKNLPLTDQARKQRENEANRLEEEIKRIERGTYIEKGEKKSLRQKAAEETRKKVAELRKAGFEVTGDDEKQIFEEIFKAMKKELVKPRKQRIGQLREELNEDSRRRSLRDDINRLRGGRRRRRVSERTREAVKKRPRKRMPVLRFDGRDPKDISTDELIRKLSLHGAGESGLGAGGSKAIETSTPKLEDLCAGILAVGQEILSQLLGGGGMIAAVNGDRA